MRRPVEAAVDGQAADVAEPVIFETIGLVAKGDLAVELLAKVDLQTATCRVALVGALEAERVLAKIVDRPADRGLDERDQCR
ncbi:hypothetical protein D3C86_1891650 [compost metagenome]